jgi:hypothetical protein
MAVILLVVGTAACKETDCQLLITFFPQKNGLEYTSLLTDGYGSAYGDNNNYGDYNGHYIGHDNGYGDDNGYGSYNGYGNVYLF